MPYNLHSDTDLGNSETGDDITKDSETMYIVTISRETHTQGRGGGAVKHRLPRVIGNIRQRKSTGSRAHRSKELLTGKIREENLLNFLDGSAGIQKSDLCTLWSNN